MILEKNIYRNSLKPKMKVSSSIQHLHLLLQVFETNVNQIYSLRSLGLPYNVIWGCK